MKNGLNQYEPVLVCFKDDEGEGKVYFVILWREYGYEVAIIKEGFRNFDLKILRRRDLEFQIKKQERRKSKDIRRERQRDLIKMDRERNNNRVLVRIIEKK